MKHFVHYFFPVQNARNKFHFVWIAFVRFIHIGSFSFVVVSSARAFQIVARKWYWTRRSTQNACVSILFCIMWTYCTMNVYTCCRKKITKKEKRKQHTISFGWEWHLFFVFPLECDITCLVWLCTRRAKGDTKTIDDMIKCLAMCDTRALAYWKLRQRQWWKWFFLYVFRVLTILSRHIFLSWRKIHDTNTCIIRDVFFFLCVSLDSGRKIQCSFIYMTQNEWASFSIHSTETTTETFSSRFFLATVRIAAAAIVVVVWCLSFTVNKVKSMMCTCVSHCLSLGAT